jgi:hypothetical protein
MSLARDAQSSGDIVAAENYLQHAEHYNRIVMAAQAQFQQTQQPQFREGSEEPYDDDRGANGRGPRDRFDFNGAGGNDLEEGEGDRFDSTEEEQERSNFQPQGQQPQGQTRQGQQRQDDRGGQRGPRPDAVEAARARARSGAPP